MRIFRPGLPALYVDEPEPVALLVHPVQQPHSLPPEIARALADARVAEATNSPPIPLQATETQPTPPRPPDPPAETPVEPKPAAESVVVAPVPRAPKPGKIPEHLRTGGGVSRTAAGQ